MQLLQLLWYGLSPPNLPWGPQVSSSEAIGIGIALGGNVLISFALNLQKLAHARLARERGPSPASSRPPTPPTQSTGNVPQRPSVEDERAPLLRSQSGGQVPKGDDGAAKKPKPRRTFLRRLGLFKMRVRAGNAAAEVPVEVAAPEELPNGGTPAPNGTPGPDNGDSEGERQESDYLRSKLWWAGFLLMNLGETGNFISYAFAPASVVAPLGTFAIIANCLFAPLLLKERFRKLDIFGIIAAIIGAITVVLSSNASDTRLDPPALIKAIMSPPFMAYAIVYVIIGIILAGLSEKSPGSGAGSRTFAWVCVDVGLCAIFGGFTVLSTKGVSTLLATQGPKAFSQWIMYPLLIVLGGTGVGQIRYLNRALMRFDSKLVIPTQFVFFNLSAIVGSALLYGDFRKASFHQLVTFLYGVAATFAGVWILAWGPNNRAHEDTADDQDGVQSATSDHMGSLAYGSFSRRGRPTLVVPNAVPIVRNKTSVVSLVGLSPAQRLLLVHTPPSREGVYDVESGL